MQRSLRRQRTKKLFITQWVLEQVLWPALRWLRDHADWMSATRPGRPTEHLPRTPGKIAVLAERFARLEPLFQAEDARLPDDCRLLEKRTRNGTSYVSAVVRVVGDECEVVEMFPPPSTGQAPWRERHNHGRPHDEGYMEATRQRKARARQRQLEMWA